jgi:hypothetical protein
MRKFVFTLLLFTGISGYAQQATPCPPLVVDVRAGTINGVKPTASMDEVKKAFPCFTGDSEEGGPFNCGGGVFFLNHDMYAYTGNDYWEVRKNFNGTVSEKILGATYNDIKKGFGKAVKKVKNGATTHYIHNMSYGSIVFVVTDGIIENFSMHALPGKKVKPCL